MSLLVLGTVALDDVRTPSGFKRNMLGGSATHFCMSARLFTDVHLVGVVGADFPKKYIDFLKTKRINLASLDQKKGTTFRWRGEYKKENLNTALTLETHLGVLETFIPQITAPQQHLPHVFLANIDPDVQVRILGLMRSPRLVGLDSMNFWIQHKRKALKKLIKKVNLFVLNDTEAKSLAEENNLIRAAKALKDMGPKWIVIKKGEHGVFFYSDNCSFSTAAYPVEKVIDPTGAGDTFAGGLMGYLAKMKKINDKVLKNSILYATTLASFNVEGFGMARTAPLAIPAVEQRMKKLKEFISL